MFSGVFGGASGTDSRVVTSQSNTMHGVAQSVIDYRAVLEERVTTVNVVISQ
jgi:hypothetical protein